MKYMYNFGFLTEWMSANPSIPKGLILKALGVQANNSMNKWLDKTHPMPIISMLRFCNSFNVPLSAFFCDLDAGETQTIISLPKINDQLEPDGGFDRNPEMRKRGERSLINPIDVNVTPSIIPGLEPHTPNAQQVITENKLETRIEPTNNTSQADIDYGQIINLQQKSQDNTAKLLAIIELQNARIEKLTNMLFSLQTQKNPAPYNEVDNFDLHVAEDQEHLKN